MGVKFANINSPERGLDDRMDAEDGPGAWGAVLSLVPMGLLKRLRFLPHEPLSKLKLRRESSPVIFVFNAKL